MNQKSSTRRTTDYGPLKDALTAHIETFPFDRVFFMTDLVTIAKANGYTEAHLPYAMSSLSRTGVVDRVDQHKKDYQTIIHYQRAKAPKLQKAKPQKDHHATIDERTKQMNTACMRLWRALGMPVVRTSNRAAA